MPSEQKKITSVQMQQPYKLYTCSETDKKLRDIATKKTKINTLS